jgi:hypothetical protein
MIHATKSAEICAARLADKTGSGRCKSESLLPIIKIKIGGLIIMLNIFAVIIVILIIVAVLVAYSCCIISAKDDMKKPDSDPSEEKDT